MDTAANELNLGALLPNMSTVVGWIQTILGLAVMAGPLILLGFGLLYKHRPPAEANYGVGYRFWWGMASLDAWKYTQRIAGKWWTLVGGILSGIMFVICLLFGLMDLMTMAWVAGICLLIELVVIAAVCIAINVNVMKKFDKDGYLREE